MAAPPVLKHDATMRGTQNLSGYRGRIFLSYSSDDRPAASRIAQALRNAGFSVFFDRNDLPPGGDYNERINAAIARSDAIVCLISPSFVRPGAYTLSEVAAAEARWPNAVGRVLPVMIAATPYASLPPYISSVTVLEPTGNPEADILRGVRRLRKWTRRWRALAAAAFAFAVLAAGGTWFGARYVEQRAVELTFAEIEVELEANARTMQAMADNSVTLAQSVLAVSEALRTPGIEIIAGLFPAENLDTDADPARLVNLYNERMDWLATSGLLEDPLQVNRATEACAAIGRTVERTRGVTARLTDLSDPRFTITDAAWSANMNRVMRASRDDGVKIAALYTDMHDARRSYGQVAGSASDYLDAIHSFCTSGQVNRASLSTALATERLAFQTLELQLRRTVEIQERAAALLTGIRARFGSKDD
jgi:hypothetical protein